MPPRALVGCLGDPEAAHEPAGLIPSRPSLRPADIFTSAAHGSLAALDIGVCSPEAAGAGLDCCAAMARRKQRTYAPFATELRQRGVRYQPLVWSSYGRAHVETLDTLQSLARAAARRRGIQDWRPLLQRTSAAISVELQRRLVGQIRRCLPDEPADGSLPDARHPPRTRVAEDEEQAAQSTTPSGDGPVHSEAAAAGVGPGGPHTSREAAAFVVAAGGRRARVELCEALRLVYGRGPPQN